MIVKSIGNGRGFMGAWKYCNHDERTAKEKASGATSRSRDRVAWTHTENMMGMTAESDTAPWLMIQTAQQNKRMQNPVSHLVISYPTDQSVSKEQMIEDGRAVLKVLGLQEHQALFFAHNDRDHQHLHMLTNRVHPETFKGQSNSFDFFKLQKWALEYERMQGKIYCAERENRARER